MHSRVSRLAAALVLALMLVAGARAQEKTFTYGQWRVQVDGGVRVLSGTAQVAASANYGFKRESATATDDGLKVVGRTGNTPMTVTFSWSAGRLRCRWESADTSRDGGFMVLTTFNGGDLAGTTVDLDGQAVRVPPTLEKHEFPHARGFRFFKEQPARTFDLSFPVCQFANLRDFRRDGRSDLQVFALAKQGVVEAVFDLTPSTVKETKNAYAGEELIENDDLHLPALMLSRNHVQNPGFEGGLAVWGEGVTDVRNPPQGREGVDWGWAMDDKEARSGKRAARYIVARGYNPAMLCSQPIAVRPGAVYTVSYYARADRPGAAISLLGQSTNWAEFPVNTRQKLTAEWTRYTAQFTVARPFVRFCFGDRWWDQTSADQVDGARIWLDDVQVEEGAAATEFTQKPVFAWTATGTRDEVVALDAKTRGVTLTLVNATDQAADVRADVQVQNLERGTLLRVPVTARVEPWGWKTAAIDLKPLAARGLLRVVADVAAGEYRETFYGRLTLFEPIPNSGRDRMRYALHRERPTPEYARYLQPFGVSGSLSFSLPPDDATVKALAGLDWMYIAGATYGKDGPVDVGHTPMTEALWAKYDAWLGEQIRRFPSQVWWKTVNEPNVGDWKWTPAEVARAVALMRKHIKAVNPRAQVLSPDPYNASRHGQAWLESFFQAGGDKLIDAVAIHTYRARPEAPDLDNDIQSLKALKAKYGLAKLPILFTEGEGVSSYSLPEIGISPFGGFWEWRLGLLSRDVGRSEIAAAALLTRTLLACLKNAGDVRYYLSWRDDTTLGQPYATLGATNYVLARLRDAAFVREYAIGNDTKTYVFRRRDGRPVAVVWSYDLMVERGEAPPVAMRVPLPAAGGWELRDMMGNALAPVAEGGVWSFPVSGRPVYLIGPRGADAALAAALERATIGTGGLRAVEIATRLAAAGRASAVVNNLLPRPVAGTLTVGVDGCETTQAVMLPPRGSAAVPIALQGAPGRLNDAPLDLRFQERDAAPVRRSERLRWLAIPRLQRPVAIDGDAGDWGEHPGFPLGAEAVMAFKKDDRSGGEGDLSATCRFGWRDAGLYAAVTVRDDVFSQKHPIQASWRGDSLQLYIDLMGDGRDRPGVGYDSNDETIWVAKVGDEDVLYREYTPEWQVAFVRGGRLAEGKCAIRRAGDMTTYELFLPLKEVFPLKMQPGTSFGLGLLINDADADGERRIALTTTPAGTEPHQRPELWPAAILSDTKETTTP